MNDEKRPEGEIKLRSPFIKKLDNYFYHYKWHTIIAAFLVIVLLVCTFQMCNKKNYDIEIMYAGPHIPSSSSSASGSALKSFTIDARDSFANAATKAGKKSPSVNFIYNWVDVGAPQSNKNLYYDEIAAGNILIYLVSPDLFSAVYAEGGFMNIKELMPELPEDLYYKEGNGTVNHHGVLLSKTTLGGKNGLKDLPPDTILCIRTVPYNFFTWFRAKKQHNAAKEFFVAALSADIPTTED